MNTPTPSPNGSSAGKTTRQTPPALAGQKLLLRLAFRNHAPANAGCHRVGLLSAFLGKIPDRTNACRRPARRSVVVLGGLGLLQPRAQSAQSRATSRRTFGGTFPSERKDFETLCGVGRSTAAAICAFAFNRRETILDGNVKRVLCRVFARDGNPQDKNLKTRSGRLPKACCRLKTPICLPTPKA